MSVHPDSAHRRFTIAQARDQLSAIVHDIELHSPVELTQDGEAVAVIVAPDASRRLFGPEGNTWGAYQRFLTAADTSDIDESVFEGVRDHSPGRDVAL